MARPTIAAGYARALLEMAVSKGADRRELLRRSRVAPEDLLNQDNRIPLGSYVDLMDASVELCHEPAFALLFGEDVTNPSISIVGLLATSAETISQGLDQINRYARLMIDEDGTAPPELIEIVRNGEGLWMVLRSTVYVMYPRITESAFARMVCGFRRQFGDRLFVKAVHVTHAEPEYRSEYDRILKVPVVFGSEKNALLIDETFLSLKMPSPNRYVFGILSEHAEALLRTLERSKTMRGRVESLMIPMLHTGHLRMETIASRLGLSRQTLYRRLKAEGVSYERVLDEMRHKMALHYLNGDKASVKEVAFLVGFSDPSAFSRAFKRWTGERPGRATSPEIES